MVGVPGIPGLSAEPSIALRQRAHRQLRHQDRAGLAKPLYDGRVVIEDLVPERTSSPGCGDSFAREKVFAAPRNPVQRSFVAAGTDFLVRLRGLREREVLGQ